jgi:hypothetical protein
MTILVVTDRLTRFAVPFKHADYLVNLHEEMGELLDTFPMPNVGAAR